MSRNLDRMTEAGWTRRQWKRWVKGHFLTPSARSVVIACKADFYLIARRSILRRAGEPWRGIYECGRLKNLTARARLNK